jgi:hypothetical protein
VPETSILLYFFCIAAPPVPLQAEAEALGAWILHSPQVSATACVRDLPLDRVLPSTLEAKRGCIK